MNDYDRAALHHDAKEKRMTLNEYQQAALKTAVFPTEHAIPYCTLGLCGEAGEVAEKVKKIIRRGDNPMAYENVTAISSEISDVVWYAAVLLNHLGVSFEDAMRENLNKLASRAERGVLKESGDNR